MFPQPPFSKIKQFFRNKIWMIPENVIGYNPIFIIQVTSLIYKKGMTILYESLFNKVTNKRAASKG
ncbi:hypothetical protein FHY71_13495 [Bacillus tropicus]|uniref:Uncharacterized protein n=1 Tax=Bacillus tropicus TaxID=2026188 RepID=A0A5C5A4J1_9BACI|nr:hypothetical protein BHL37_15735 [Bacillus cereus]PJZ23415.1 hypothetical protein CEW46_02970 [Bacillus cereus]TNP14326.1 hypothetical protein FHY71_13495 [Bacillus tropicus]TNP15827.1 hypothetical protein FHY73_21415 [Bacillus tropicus]